MDIERAIEFILDQQAKGLKPTENSKSKWPG